MTITCRTSEGESRWATIPHMGTRNSDGEAKDSSVSHVFAESWLLNAETYKVINGLGVKDQ